MSMKHPGQNGLFSVRTTRSEMKTRDLPRFVALDRKTLPSALHRRRTTPAIPYSPVSHSGTRQSSRQTPSEACHSGSAGTFTPLTSILASLAESPCGVRTQVGALKASLKKKRTAPPRSHLTHLRRSLNSLSRQEERARGRQRSLRQKPP